MSHLNTHTQITNVCNMRTMDPGAFVIRDRETLFRMGDHINGVYMINSGSVKLMRTSESGELQIIGFYMAGELIGLDALADGISRTTAVIMETSNITLIPFESIINRDESFDYQAFIQQVGVSFNRDNDHSKILSQCTADRRLAWFLINYSDNLAKRGLRANDFRIPMKRADIASYLGMAVETLSRELAIMCKKGFIKKNLRNIELQDIDHLRKIACGSEVAAEHSHNHIGMISTKEKKLLASVH